MVLFCWNFHFAQKIFSHSGYALSVTHFLSTSYSALRHILSGEFTAWCIVFYLILFTPKTFLSSARLTTFLFLGRLAADTFFFIFRFLRIRSYFFSSSYYSLQREYILLHSISLKWPTVWTSKRSRQNLTSVLNKVNNTEVRLK